MATWNDITGDPLVSRTLTKEGEDNFDKIFGKKKTNGGWKPPLTPLETHKILKREEVWTEPPINLWEEGEKRIENIGRNSNEGLHYEDTKTQTVSETDVSKPDT